MTDPESDEPTSMTTQSPASSPENLAVPLVSSPRSVSPGPPPRAELRRRPSHEVVSRFNIMRLNSQQNIAPPLSSPGLRTDQLYSPMTGLGTLGSPGPSAMRPGGLARHGSAVRTPGGGFADGHWYSTPSPTRVPGGMDPFEASFVAATPSVSSASEGSVEDGVMSP